VCSERGGNTLGRRRKGDTSRPSLGRSPGSKVLLIHEKVKARHHSRMRLLSSLTPVLPLR